jgi:hypothetical protein
MNYTLEHLKLAYNAGAKKLPFNQILDLIALLGESGIKGLLGEPGTATTPLMTPRFRQRGRPKGSRKTSQREGNLSDKILHFLNSKGEVGAHTKEIAAAIHAPQSSISVWFYNTGKKYLKAGEIKKTGPATYRYSPSTKAE